MARISELHYSNAYASSSGVSEFLEVSLSPGEDPADFTVSFYQADGSLGVEITLDQAGVQSSLDPDTGEMVYVISNDDFGVFLTDPDGNGANNYEAYALTNTATSTVIDFYDIGGGTTNITAVGGVANGAVSENLAVPASADTTTSSLQFNQPNPDQLVFGSVNPGDGGITCFAAGTMVETPDGLRRIETLVAGDLVMTRDHGPQPLRWTGQKTVTGQGNLAPVRITAGTLGATRDVLVSQQHKLLVQGWLPQLHFGEDEVLVAAKALINGDTVRLEPMAEVTYCHLLFDRHEILTTEGLESESLYPGAFALGGLDADVRAELLELFPDLAAYGEQARPVCLAQEGVVLAVA